RPRGRRADPASPNALESLVPAGPLARLLGLGLPFLGGRLLGSLGLLGLLRLLRLRLRGRARLGLGAVGLAGRGDRGRLLAGRLRLLVILRAGVGDVEAFALEQEPG